MPEFIAAIDQGTTSTRCIIFDAAGRPVAGGQHEHEQIFPKPGWVEHDPAEIWRRTQQCIADALRRSRLSGSDIAGVGITNQRETTIVWDRETGQPLHNAIVWQDTRTDAICKRLSAGGEGDRFRDRTGLPIATYFSATKLAWLLENVPGLRDKADAGRAVFGNVDTFLIWHLTGATQGGAHVTDVTNASRTLLMNLATLDWDDELLAAFDIPRNMLPTIRPSSEPGGYGRTRNDGPFGAAIPVCGDLGDQQAALVGQTCFQPGEAKNTYGTGCFLLLNTGEKPIASKHGLLTTVAYQFADAPAVFALEGSIAVTGSLVQWLRDNLGLFGASSDIEPLARSVNDNGGAYIVPAFSGLFAPHWRSDARGVIAGLTRYVTRGHLARAALEATAYQTREVVDAMQSDSGVELKSLRVDGGMTVNDLLMQFQADILAAPVIRPTVSETTALGAAYAAGLATGLWRSTDELRAQWRIDRQWEPRMSDDQRAALFAGWKKAVQRTLGWEA